jgi:hypothetical protein
MQAIMRKSLVSIIEAGGSEGMRTDDDMHRLEAEVKADVGNGTMLSLQMWWTWGQKPARLEDSSLGQLPGCGCCGPDM